MDDPRNNAGEYPVAPLPKSFGDATSPAYQPAEPPRDPDTYDVGPEVSDADFSIGATSWQEAAARVHRGVDEFGVEPPQPKQSSMARFLVRLHAERRLQAKDDARIATVSDPARFTLRSLFLMMTFASVVLALGSRFSRPIFAGVCGLAAFVTLLGMRLFRGGGAVVQLAWVTLLTVYLTVALLAALGL
jgi:hypothetical protein